MIKQGSIVKAKAGRDKDMFFVVLGLDKDYAYIADGKRRRVEKPKKKKLIHLQATNSLAECYETNRQIRSVVNQFGGYNV